MKKPQSIFDIFLPQRFAAMALLGFSSGLPLLLTSSTLSFWLAAEGVSLTQIGLLGLVILPYSLKFAWAPLVDRTSLPYLTPLLGHRRSWLLLSQIAVMLILWAFRFVTPQEDLLEIGILACLLSFMAATQDMVLLAFQADDLEQKSYGHAEAMTVFGYRFGMLTAGAGALYLSEFLSWADIYAAMAALMGIGIITTLTVKEPTSSTKRWEAKANEPLPPQDLTFSQILRRNILTPFLSFCKVQGWLPVLLLMMHYKLGDNLIGSLSAIFYHDLGFSAQEIASASKVFGMWATVIGGFLGGALISRLGLISSLFWFGLIHGLSLMLYIYLGWVGKDISLLYLTIAIENITGGMRTTALLSFRFALAQKDFGATHMAIMTSFIHLGRALYSAPSGALVESLGWISFFTLVAFSTIPSLALVMWVGKKWKPVHEEAGQVDEIKVA